MRRLFLFVSVLQVFLGWGLSFSQNQPGQAPKAPDVTTYLKETINWYHGRVVEQNIANETGDLTLVNQNQEISGQIVRLAFDFAREEEQNESKQAKSGPAQDQKEVPSQYQRLAQAAATADLQFKQSQKELESLRKKLETSSGKKRQEIESLVSETESELAFHQAHRDALNNILQFATKSSKNEAGAVGLKAQIEELASSVPAALSSPGGTPAKQGSTEPSAKISPPKNRQDLSGIWGLAADLFRLSHKKHILDQRLESTNHLIETAKQVRAPLVANLRGLVQSADQLANQSPSTNPTALAQQKKQLDAFTAQFKEISDVLLPLGKQGILLNLYNRTLINWQQAVRDEYSNVMRSFLVRIGILAIIFGVVFAAGEAWRRAIFRYIREPRRRYQLLLLRKIIIWIVVVIIIAFTFATKLGSVATFAGLLTAGVAVALQNVILSVAGYFFLMGKYGIRVGDRVQVANVIGEVVDIGLVRLHLLELSGSGSDAQPSGRVVAFSNSIVFQPTSGVFRKIPGTSFVWHEIRLMFSPESNYRTVQERITAAVDNVLKDYREELERQGQRMEQALNSISAIELRPKTHLHFTASGIEATVRFPVELKSAVEIDERMMRELYSALEQEPKLKLEGLPTLRTDLSTPSSA